MLYMIRKQRQRFKVWWIGAEVTTHFLGNYDVPGHVDICLVHMSLASKALGPLAKAHEGHVFIESFQGGKIATKILRSLWNDSQQVSKYPLVIKHGNGKSRINGGFGRKITEKWSTFRCHAMFDYRRVRGIIPN